MCACFSRSSRCWRRSLTGRTTAACRKREAPPPRCSALLKRLGGHAQRGALRVRSKLECCVSSLEKASDRARSLPSHVAVGLGLGMAAKNVAPRLRAKERSLLPVQRCSNGPKPTTPSATRCARARQAYVLRHSPETAKASACALASHAAAGFALRVAAGTSRHGRAPKERTFPPVQRSLVGLSRPQPARHGARAASSSTAPPPQRQRAPAPVRLLHTQQLASHWRR